MPEAGEYLLTHVSFSKNEEPVLLIARDDIITPLYPLGKTFTLQFDTSARYCSGWYDMNNGENHPCPDNSSIDSKYELCPACQNRTGFNPAFYHATSVSKQQEQRNLQPHFLYLAHFAKGITKVGISYARRGNSRLLEQGARTALVLDTFPTAHIARQYEARIATFPGIVENVQLRKKIELLYQSYDKEAAIEELTTTRTSIEQALGKEVAKNDVLHLDASYFPSGISNLSESFDCSGASTLSGTMIGALGSLFFCWQQDTPLFLPMKKYVGYKLQLTHTGTRLALPARQISLF